MNVCNPVLETRTEKYSVQPGLGFCAAGYLKATGSVHTGIDLNDVRGSNSDLGAPVYAVADGVVVSAQFYTTWGNIVLIHHPALGVWTQYAHLNEMAVKAGQAVRMGGQIGTIGRGAANRFIAHLHFEVRRVLLPASNWPSTRLRNPADAEREIRAGYLDPEAWLAQHGALRTLAEVQEARRAPPADAAAIIPLLGVPGYDRARVMKMTDGPGLKGYGIKIGEKL